MDNGDFLITAGFAEIKPAVGGGSASPTISADFSTGDLDKLSLDDSAFELSGADFSITGWFKAKELEITRFIIGYGAGNAAASFNWYIGNTTASNVRITISDGSSTDLAQVNHTTTLDTDWHFFAATFNNTTKLLSISIDDGTPGTTTATGITLPSLSSTFFIGLGTGFTSPETNFKGLCMGIWSGRILNSGEITALYNSGSPRLFSGLTSGEKTSLVEWFDLKETSAGSSAVQRDNSVSARHLADTNTTPSSVDAP